MLTVLAGAGIVSIEASLSGVLLIFAGISMLTWVVVWLFTAIRGETVAYRVLYHADQQPNNTAITRMLNALARNAGYVGLIWRFEPGKVPPNVSLYVMAPVAAQKALEGMLSGLLPGVWAEKCPVPDPLKPPSPGWTVGAWRWDSATEGNKDLADPFACGIHLGGLAASLGRSDGAGPKGEVEVRLKLWPHGWSAVVMAQNDTRHLPTSRPSLTRLNLSRVAPQLSDEPSRPSQLSPLPFLKPLLWGRTMWWPLHYDSADSQDPSGSVSARSEARKRRNLASAPAYAGLRGRVVSALAANYPLWGAWAANTMFGRIDKKQPGTVVSQTEETDATDEHNILPMGTLLFPSTTGFNVALDSIETGELSLQSSYLLPPIPSQILVFGRATCDGRAIGVPALRKVHSAASAPTGSAADASPISNARTPNGHERMGLHPMLAEHLLVAGGSDAWRRDVAGSLVSQALDMGVTVVAVDGGPPPDEPPLSARYLSRITSPDLKRRGVGMLPFGSAGVTGADPLSPIILRVGDRAHAEKWVAQIDLDNPAGSVHPNMLYVAASPWLPPLQGEATATSLALETGLAAQMRFLRAVNVTGMDVGIDVARTEDSGPGMAILEAWLTVLLLRHHRARLLLASRGISSSASGRDPRVLGSSPVSASHKASSSPSSSSLPSCPDLPALMVVLEQSETLLSLLQRERAAWSDPEWLALIQKAGVAGERALHAANAALARASEVECIDPHDLFLYGAALRGQLKRVVGRTALVRMLSRPHVSLTDLLHPGTIRMLRVNLSGAYRTATPPYSDDDLARKTYGLYLLWALWAVSNQRQSPIMEGVPPGYSSSLEPDPLLLVLHGAGAWFGSGSPLSEPSNLRELGRDGSDIAVAATVSGLRHLRAYRGRACEEFGNLVFGPAPVADMDAPDVTLLLVDQENRLIQDGMQRVVEKTTQEDTHVAPTPAEVPRSNPPGKTLDAGRLLGVLKRIEDGDALVVTSAPGGRKIVCTAQVGSSTANDLRVSWPSAPSVAVPSSPSSSSPAAESLREEALS